MVRQFKHEYVGTKFADVDVYHQGRMIDNRGWFSQVWTTGELKSLGFRGDFVQLNMSTSRHGVLRGMHRQDQTKLIQVINGSIFDVVLNPETKEWCGFHLVEGEMLYVPPQYAHGFFVTSDTATIQYLVDKPYNKDLEENFKWNEYGIEWPLSVPVLSDKDR